MVIRRQIKRRYVLAFFQKLTPCHRVVALEQTTGLRDIGAARIKSTIRRTQSSRVKRCVRLRMAGAANSTIGSIMIQATNHDCSQWVMKVPVATKGKLAIPAAIAQVRPD